MSLEKRDLFNEKLDASLGCKSVNTVIISRENYSRLAASLERLQNEDEKPKTSLEYSYLRRYKLVEVDGVKKVARRGVDTLLAVKEDLFDVIEEAHLKTEHGGRHVMDKELRRSYSNVTVECINIYLALCEECQGKNTMPTKREMVAQTTQPPDKMIKREILEDLGGDPIEDTGLSLSTSSTTAAKIMENNSETQDVEGGDPPVEDDEFREAEDPTYSPFSNHQTGEIIFEDNCATPRTGTDTIRLLMKIEKLQAELRYERRCRMLAERELRELKEMNALMMQMRHTARELCVAVDHIRNGSDAEEEVPTQSNDESLSFITENETQETESYTETRLSNHIPEDDDENYQYLAEGLRVPRILYERIAQITDFKKYISALLMILFERETLASHSLGGRTNVTMKDNDKPQLPADTMKSIIDHVASKFGTEVNQIKLAIRTKLSNEDKLLRKRQQVKPTNDANPNP